ncbi:sugar transferase [Chryseobacterium sp. Leaf180]|nr:sugar transferase [Chryseobacterium sp. Leaf180]
MDYVVSSIAVVILLPFLLILFLAASADTGFPGIFSQQRIGRFGKPFVIWKFKTYHHRNHTKSAFGNWMRRTKLDELPQLINILFGDMSLVGPRPDIPGYYDQLTGENRLILELKPGLTSEAGIIFRNEEFLLSKQKNPLLYNDEILFPEKVRLNLKYYRELSLKNDFMIIWKTLGII